VYEHDKTNGALKKPSVSLGFKVMSSTNKIVSIHPYFRVKPGKLREFKALLPKLVAKTQPEKKNLFYDFTINGHEVFCREAYYGASGLLTHINSVDALIEQMLTMSTLLRVEIHGAASELKKLRRPLAKLKPAWFVYECGVTR
jgi:hypothetical protein